MKNEDKLYIIIICVVWAIFRFPFVQALPLQLDEGLYAQMTNQFIQNPALQPVFMGEIVSWRPIGYFLINAPFVLLGKALALDVDLTYRLSSLFFSFLTCFALYFLIKEMYNRADIAFVGTLFYQSNFATVFVSNRGLTDSVLMFFITASLYFYFRGKAGKNDFLVAGGLAFIAYFIKTAMAVAIPFLAICYWLLKDRKVLFGRQFMLSLLAIPIAAVLVAIIMNASNGQLGSDISTLLVKFDGGHSNFAEVMISASVVFIAMIGMFIGFFASGLKKIAKFDPFIILWLCMLPILIWGSQVGMPWYLLPAMPAVGVVIAVGAFDKKMKFDKFASFVFAFLILMTLAIVVYYYSSVAAGPQYEKEAGQYLAGKDNVMVAGYYAPGLLFYKYNIDSKTKNICTIVTGLKGANNTFGAQADGPAKSADDVVLGAYFAPPGSDEYDNRWTDAFWDKRPLKIGCGGFEPEYLAAVGLQPGTVAKMGNFTLVDNASGEILIYKKSG